VRLLCGVGVGRIVGRARDLPGDLPNPVSLAVKLAGRAGRRLMVNAYIAGI